MIAELGHFALVLALFAAIVQSTLPLLGAQKGWADYMRVAEPAATAQFALVGISYAALTYAFVASDFSVALAAQHSHSTQPLIYKFTSVWGNHEGSMLLWVLVLALFGGMVAWFGRNLPIGLKARTIAVQGMIGVAFLAFILFTSNPFTRLFPTPADGADLNPVLQDPGLAFHPPFLYLGYVGLSTAFSFAMAALIEGRVDAAWARWVRPWTLAAWVFLTIGIALGSYWAYYELGWGGWWFWDPVENASFMPWLAAAALLHSAIVVEKRGELKSWTVLLAILAFSLSLVGTFIVRSGVLTSVHAFASDPSRGVFILLILAIAVGGSLWLFAHRANQLASGGVFAPISRESALLLNNVLLIVSLIAVFAGTMAPLVYEAFGRTVTVGAPFFDWVFGLLMLPLILALPVGAMLPWKRGDLGPVLQRLAVAAGLALVLGGGAYAYFKGGGFLAPLGVTLAVWLILGAMWDVGTRIRLGEIAWANSWSRLVGLPRSEWGKTLGHAGLGMSVLGITLVTALETEEIRLAKPGDRWEVGGYGVHFLDIERRPLINNYRADVARFEIFDDGDLEGVLTPERRFFPVQSTTTTETALREGLWDDVYLYLGERREDGQWAVTVYVKPFVNWIWFGALAMSIGGLISLSDRRHRVGAPSAKKAPAAGAAATPAE
ncbi:MAG: heme lyase CcmF/NrfE family subunit [Pseudomonadota bacterium]